MTNDFPCVCGHSKSQHMTDWAWADGANACFISIDSPEYHLCNYIPDNLRFLEEKYGQNVS